MSNERLGIVEQRRADRARYGRHQYRAPAIEKPVEKPVITKTTAVEKPLVPLTPQTVLRRRARVRFIGDPGTIAYSKLVWNRAYTVEWCGWYFGTLRVRVVEQPGWTFLRSLFVEAG